tara:strand:- start:240 stop:1307 length:1068 start_codon:yes stop_codon:yes gene_type:complete
MIKNKKTNIESENKMLDKQLNTMLTSIGNNTIQNEVTSMGIVQRNNELFQGGNFKYNNDSIYSMLGIKAPNQILTETRGFDSVDRINSERKRLVDRIILPLANFKNLVESEKEKATKLDKKKTKEANKSKPEPDHTIKKSNDKIIANAIRTTANRVMYPSLFIMTLDKSNYKFDKKVVSINLFCLKNEIVKSIFGLDNDNLKKATDSKVYFVDCNFSLLEKLTQKYMFNISIDRSITATEQSEDLEATTDDIISSEYTDEKAEKMMKSICSQLTYLDDNNGLDAILKVENHLRTLTNYGVTLEEIVETARKQSKGGVVKDLYGSWVVDNATSVELKGNTIEELKGSFNKQFKIAV